MLDIKKIYLKDENNNPIAVQLDIKTFQRIEEIIEDHALGILIEENNPDEYLTLEDAKEHYKDLNNSD